MRACSTIKNGQRRPLQRSILSRLRRALFFYPFLKANPGTPGNIRRKHQCCKKKVRSASCRLRDLRHLPQGRDTETGERIIASIRPMHDRSNGLGGGFVGYGIYPEYADYYAFHVFYDTPEAKAACEKEIEHHFDIVDLSKSPRAATRASRTNP